MDVNSTEGGLRNVSGYAMTKIVTSVLGSSIIFLNGFSIIMIPFSKTLPSRQKVMFTSLILTDICAGTLLLNVSKLSNHDYDSGHILCQILLYMGIIIVYSTMFINFLITLERFLSLSFPLSTTVTWRKLLIAAITAWIVSIITSIATFSGGFSGMPSCVFVVYGHSLGYLFMSLTGLIVFFVKMFIYIYIAKVTRRHLRQIASTMVGVAAENDGRRYLNKAEVRSTVTVGIILVCFGISYLPLYTACVYTSIFLKDKDEFMKINSKVIKYLTPLFLVNSLINPFVYIWRLKNCRKELIARISCHPN